MDAHPAAEVEVKQAGKIKVGDHVPNFSLPQQDGSLWQLSSLIGQKIIVLYFYPKDETPGCTAEACSFRDQYDVFTQAGAAVIGISSDSVAAHEKFAAHHRLPFTLLSDANGEVRRLLGVPRTLGILPGRVTYIIDKKGVVAKIFNSQMQAQKHVQEAVATVKMLQSQQ